LDEAGWVKASSGIREKDGVPLTVNMVAYPQRPSLVTVQPVIKRTFEALGITVNAKVTSSENWDELDAIIETKDFDLLLWAQHTLPAGDPQFFINHFFRFVPFWQLLLISDILILIVFNILNHILFTLLLFRVHLLQIVISF